MEIILTEHIIKRARKRFKLKPEAIKKMIIKALDQGEIENQTENRIAITYAHFYIIAEVNEVGYKPITIIDSNGIAKHDETITESIYLKGKKTKYTYRKRD